MSQKNIQVVLLGTDAKLAETISMLARHEDCLFNLAGNYADALRLVQTSSTDIVLLDLKSAETDGLNLLRQLKHHPPIKPVFTIGLAAGNETTSLLRAFDIGLNENIQLPLESSLFRAQLRTAGGSHAPAARTPASAAGVDRGLPHRRGQFAGQVRFSGDHES